MIEDPEERYSLTTSRTVPYDPNFDKRNYQLIHVYHKDGFAFFSSNHRSGKHSLFEIYEIEDIKSEKPDFIQGVENLIELLYGNESSFEEQRLKKWYKRAVVEAFYETVKFLGYEHEWDEISKMLPTVFQIPKEKMELYCGKDTIVAYQRLFGELWSDKPYPSPFNVGAEFAHMLKDYKNPGRTVKLNSLQKEHEEWVEKLIELHLMKLMGHDSERTSLSDKEIEKIQISLRFGPEDPHAGYYEADLNFLEKVEKALPSERRKLLSYEGYLDWLNENSNTPKKRFFTALNMLNVMYRTGKDCTEQKRNRRVMMSLVLPSMKY